MVHAFEKKNIPECRSTNQAVILCEGRCYWRHLKRSLKHALPLTYLLASSLCIFYTMLLPSVIQVFLKMGVIPETKLQSSTDVMHILRFYGKIESNRRSVFFPEMLC